MHLPDWTGRKARAWPDARAWPSFRTHHTAQAWQRSTTSPRTRMWEKALQRGQIASTAAIAVSFLLVLVAAIALNINLQRLRESFTWVDHTDRTLLRAGLLNDALVEIAAAARIYAATGDPNALGRLIEARRQLPDSIARLRSLCTGNPPQIRRVDALAAMTDAYTRWEESEARARQAAPAAHGLLVETADMRGLAGNIRDGLADFRSTEIGLLAGRQRKAARGAAFATGLATATTLLALLSGGLGILLLLRGRQQHRLREIETELIHVSRLNTVGQTASVLAHEVNQPLTAARNYVSGACRLLRTIASPEAVRATEALQLAQAQVERATQIISRLRRHVQSNGPDRHAAAPHTVIEEAIVLSGLRNGAVALGIEVERNLPDIFVDPVQMQQVLINLMRNADEAMVHSARRELRITAARQGEAVCIAVHDTGVGLAPALADRLFRPFTSTKPDGMGIGLSICRSIVEAHGGTIWAEPNGPNGTIFLFTVPTARHQAELRGTAEQRSRNAPGSALSSAD